MVQWMRLWWWIGVVIGGILVCLGDGTLGQSFAHKTKEAKISRPLPRAEKKEEPKLIRVKRDKNRRVLALRSSDSRRHRTQVKSRITRSKRSVKKLSRPALIVRESVPLPEPEPGKDFQSMLLADAETGQLLLTENIDKQWPTASLAKMMVGLLAMEDLEQERLSLKTPVVISSRASRAGGRTINLRPGEVFPFGELLQAMLVTSANDAAVAVAERIRGSVEACVIAMNQKARALGMRKTRYQTVNGMPLPGGRVGDISSARDLAVLGMELIRYHRVLDWTSLGYIPFRAGMTMLPNTNHLVGRVYGVNGLKTGFTVRARYNLVATAQRGEKSLIVVVLGGRNSRVRFDVAEEFLEWGFSHDVRRTELPKVNEELDDSFRISPAAAVNDEAPF